MQKKKNHGTDFFFFSFINDVVIVTITICQIGSFFNVSESTNIGEKYMKNNPIVHGRLRVIAYNKIKN